MIHSKILIIFLLPLIVLFIIPLADAEHGETYSFSNSEIVSFSGLHDVILMKK